MSLYNHLYEGRLKITIPLKLSQYFSRFILIVVFVLISK